MSKRIRCLHNLLLRGESFIAEHGSIFSFSCGLTGSGLCDFGAGRDSLGLRLTAVLAGAGGSHRGEVIRPGIDGGSPGVDMLFFRGKGVEDDGLLIAVDVPDQAGIVGFLRDRILQVGGVLFDRKTGGFIHNRSVVPHIANPGGVGCFGGDLQVHMPVFISPDCGLCGVFTGSRRICLQMIVDPDQEEQIDLVSIGIIDHTAPLGVGGAVF